MTVAMQLPLFANKLLFSIIPEDGTGSGIRDLCVALLHSADRAACVNSV